MKRNVPYRTHEQIALEVDRFRLLTGVAEYLGIPIDSISLADLVFRLDMVRFPGLSSRFKQEAAITPDLLELYVDAEAFDGLNTQTSWTSNRLRFSVAHELGHLFMHAEEITANRFGSLREFKLWMGDRTQPTSAEYQADEFAGRLLVPRESLLEWYDRYVGTAQGNDPQWWEHTGARTKLARNIAPHFGVNHQVIETRFDREGLWSVSNMLPNDH